ncbi:MAG: 3'-5' exonuclease, partial [Bacteroidota bacterium]
MEYALRVFDFNVYNASAEENTYTNKDNNVFMIQIFGLDETGKTYSVTVDGFKPFFYVKVNDHWTIDMKEKFISHLREKMGPYYGDSITDSKLIKRKKLYGFDNKKEHKFIYIEFANMRAFNNAKNVWYSDYQSGHTLLKDGYHYLNTHIALYEANIPPLLRFFHVKNMSPTGWIAIPKKKAVETRSDLKTVHCTYQLSTNLKYIIPLNEKETIVPFKIMSFDIEASSSHGDFPVPIKTYKKLSTNIVEYFENHACPETEMRDCLTKILLAAFGYGTVDGIDLVYPKKRPSSQEAVLALIDKWLNCRVRSIQKTSNFDETYSLELLFEKLAKEASAEVDDDDAAVSSDGEEHTNHTENVFETELFVKPLYNHAPKEYTDKKATIIDVLLDKKYEREGKLNELNISLNSVFPPLEGDKVTFIGSTFMSYGNKDPHYHHCIVLDTCTEIPNCDIETYNTEREVLLAWQKLVQRENPDIIIGYNIFGFDYEFLFRRAEENACTEDFLKLSRNAEEICGIKDKETGKWKIEEKSIQIASGQHDLRYISMNGRCQVDLYNFYRRSENLSSYKLDYVGGYFIGDYVKKTEWDADRNKTIIYTNNMTGLLNGNYIHVEEIGHSVDYYEDGAKFVVSSVDKAKGTFELDGHVQP